MDWVRNLTTGTTLDAELLQEKRERFTSQTDRTTSYKMENETP
jgi:hypothetical protein